MGIQVHIKMICVVGLLLCAAFSYADPCTPTNVSATLSPGGDQVELTWQDNCGEEDNYVIQRKPYLGVPEWRDIAALPADTTSYTDSENLHGMVDYSYRIGAFTPGSAGSNLTLLPESSRYFTYKGLPMVLFWGTHHWDWQGRPNEDQVMFTASYANFSTLSGARYRYTSYPQFWDRINDDSYWQELRQSVEYGLAHDVIFHVYFYDGHWDIEYVHAVDKYTSFHYDDPNSASAYRDLGEYGLPGITPRMIHERLADKVVEHLWDMPNIIFDMCFEPGDYYALYDWWNSRVKQAGSQQHADITHMMGTMRGGRHPHTYSSDLIIGQAEVSEYGFHPEPAYIPQFIYDYNVPLIRMAVTGCCMAGPPFSAAQDYMTTDNDKAHLMLRQMGAGINSSETYGGKEWQNNHSPEAERWFLQLRWYQENIRSWDNEPGDEITYDNLPRFVNSQRPYVDNVSGYSNGARKNGNKYEFACVYTDPDNEAPAQAEVWVDVDGDGRFDPDPSGGERITMQASGNQYAQGVTYTAGNITAVGRKYVFRFADPHWYPPAGGEVIHINNAGSPYQPGISYDSWYLPL